MKRRVVLLTCLLGLIGGGAGAAFATPHATAQNHNICLVSADHENYHNTQYYCVTTP